MKESGTQFDDRVVEVVWDFSVKNWKLMRIRDDKTHGNHKDVVKSVIESIIDGVEVDIVSVSSYVNVQTAELLTWLVGQRRGGCEDCLEVPGIAWRCTPPVARIN